MAYIRLEAKELDLQLKLLISSEHKGEILMACLRGFEPPARCLEGG
jgi:hypothetical protein